jgi:hypothetical protein
MLEGLLKCFVLSRRYSFSQNKGGRLKNVRAEDPNDDAIANDSAEHDHYVEDSQKVVENGIDGFERPPVRMNMS